MVGWMDGYIRVTQHCISAIQNKTQRASIHKDKNTQQPDKNNVYKEASTNGN
jgi:hypothetical protein